MIHIDIDPAEIGKNRQPDVPIVGDVATVLKDLIPEIKREQAVHGKPDTSHWWDVINKWVEDYPITWDEPTDGSLAPQWVVKQLSDMADPDTIDEAFGDDPDEFDDLGGLNDGDMETLEEGLRPKRKRKRKR